MSETLNLEIDDELAEEAARWVARLQSSDASLSDQEEFEAWLAEDQMHFAAFEEMRHLWSDLEQVPIPEDRLEALKKARRNAKLTISSLIVALGVSLGAYQDGVFDRWQADHYTAVGEVRRINLADGSTMFLNTDSAVAVHYSDQERRIELLRGEAFFDVVSNKARPFIVESGDFTAKAVGTRYSVRTGTIFGDGDAQVLEGLVEVQNERDKILLKQGQFTKLNGQQHLTIAHHNVEQYTAWRKGQLVFSNRPLGEIAASLSRYRSGRIVVVGDKLKRQKISGIFDLDKTDEALDILEQSLSLKVTYLTDMLVIVQIK